MRQYLPLLYSCLAGFSTILGAFIIFIPIKNTQKLMSGCFGLASGVMISVSIFELFPESYQYFIQKLFFNQVLFLFGIFIIMGILCSFIIHKITVYISDTKLYQISIFTLIILTLHNFPEGIATFYSTMENAQLGLNLAIAFALHNIPEGIAIALPLYHATKSKVTVFKACALSGLSEPLGALISYLFIGRFLNLQILSIIFIIVATMMLFVSIREFIPLAIYYKHYPTFICFFLMGVLMMFINHAY